MQWDHLQKTLLRPRVRGYERLKVSAMRLSENPNELSSDSAEKIQDSLGLRAFGAIKAAVKDSREEVQLRSSILGR